MNTSNKIFNQLVTFYFFSFLACIYLSSCGKDKYYIDGGVANGKFEGSTLEYLTSKPREFDSLVTVIKLAGLEETFEKDEITFFAPRDENIKALIGNIRTDNTVNNLLYFLGRDTVKALNDIDSTIWRKYLLRHVFKGKHKLADYPQIDFEITNVYPGENYYSYSGDVSNIGVVFNDAGGVKYAGYRQLYISYISDMTNPDQRYSVPVASSDIEPDNGVVHVLDYTKAEFGFSQYDMVIDIENSKR
ncbi:Fasciclin domain-containing protein [bacterium A37T11]|nr:Fasciclin domain-containing protein [bacterium A37T11]